MHGLLSPFGVALALPLLSGCGDVDESSGLIGSRSNAPVVINEVLPKNDLYLADADGNTTDLVELYNTGAVSVNLSGFFLSDDPENLMKARLGDAVEVPAGGVITLRANKDDLTGDPLTVPLGLSASGDRVILSDSFGAIVDSVVFDAGATGTNSFGRYPDGTGTLQWCGAPSPGALNGAACGG